MTTLGIIPARGGSQRLPGKNTRLLAGKPLIVWTIEAALASKLDRVVVSTDNLDVWHAAIDTCVSLIQRPGSLATSDSPVIDTVFHALEWATEDFDEVMLLQPTSPQRTAADIDRFLGCSHRPLVSVNEFGDPNGAMYLISVNALRACRTFNPEEAFHVPFRYVDIDTQEDFDEAERQMNG